MPITPRSEIVALPGYAARRSESLPAKLANNELPEATLPPPVAAAIAAAVAESHRYPDMAATDLLDRLAERHALPAGRLAVGCGSVALCQQVIQALCRPGDEVMFAWRSFEAYPVFARMMNATGVPVALDDGHAHDLDAMLAAITPRTRIVFVCNPNNPTGTVVSGEALRSFVARVPPDVLVVIDEAYREFVTDPGVLDGLEAVRGAENVAVLRTFSKAYGLAALRVGYLAGPATVASAVRKVGVPFGVNGIAQAAAVAALAVEGEVTERCRRIAAERDRVRGDLRAQGYPVPATQANFVWLPLGDRTGDFVAHAAAHGVDVRGFAGDGVRVTIGGPAGNAAFLRASGSFLSAGRELAQRGAVGQAGLGQQVADVPLDGAR
ncbi:histidinol-phosphate aminotransferase [Actinoplanes campanulatus]|uniref:Histidinol-phosphate aminotransferase n=1 Tax=Actinoplanes campanulatus TaxID=113559 RepID=A0A7W5AQR3_9ACTN|nr:histidinol-phosphate transaminase [Actinoplanes campanulatus]MBB3100713.1 histidinol-phosphate aminotransferase [Actinoplanes campanulatus]GGN45954.1 putative phenylalanine aminotransferase [Actinoplanes campanulatus]GID41225.1 putative phenylalanine aminotransferase [Actinoplanes campanulatus]